MSGTIHTEESMKFLTEEEVLRYFNVIDNDTSLHSQRNKAIFYIAKYCALRASEVGRIKLTDYDPKTRTIFCRRLKDSNPNCIEIVNPKVSLYLDEYYFNRKSLVTPSPYLFVSQKGTPINRRTLDKMIKHYGKMAEIPAEKRHFHVLKHTRAMELINYADIELQDAQWWLGHKSIENTMIYLYYTTKAQKRLFKKVAYHEGGNIYANEQATY